MSACVAALEEELGALLLDRRDKQFRLTVAGTRFMIYAQKLLELPPCRWRQPPGFLEVQGLRVLKCDVRLPPLPIHASYRSDPATGLAEKVLISALAFM